MRLRTPSVENKIYAKIMPAIYNNLLLLGKGKTGNRKNKSAMW